MNECYYFGHFFLLNLLCFRELGTGGKHLNSILHSSFGPETPAKGPLGMGIPSEINDESPPQRGELQTVLPHFFFFFLLSQHPLPPILLFTVGRPGERKSGAAVAAFLAGVLWVLSVGAQQHPLAVPAPVRPPLGGPSQG